MDENKTVSTRLAFLDVARGLAALLVFFEHALAFAFDGYLAWARANLHIGQIGVLLFLTISGYIIPHSLQQSGSNGRFWLRRFFRLFPAYWACILLGFLCARLDPRVVQVGPNDAGTWLANLTMLQGFMGYPHIWGIFWTLQLELIVYTACSLLFSLRLLVHARLLLWLVAAAYLVTLTYVARKLNYPIILWLQTYYAAPMVGFVAHDLLNGRGRRSLSLALLAALMLAPLRVRYHHFRWLQPSEATRYVREYYAHFLVAYALFFALAAARHRWMPKLACRLGVISYSIYLLHPIIQMSLRSRGLPPWLFLTGALALTLALSEVMYRLVESPCVALGRAVERRLFRPRRVVAAAEETAVRRAA